MTTETLPLVEYRNGMAVFEREPVPLLSGEGLEGITVQLSLRSWERLGRPAAISVTYTVEAA